MTDNTNASQPAVIEVNVKKGSHFRHVRKAELGEIPNGADVSILPVEGGLRVDFGGLTGCVFPEIFDLNIVDGKPLYIADLPSENTTYCNQQLVVYGIDEYMSPEFVDKIVGVIDGKPVFVGHNVDGGPHDDTEEVVHGDKSIAAYNKIGDVRIVAETLIFAGYVSQLTADCGGDSEGWYVHVGVTEYGPYKNEPRIETDWRTNKARNGMEVSGVNIVEVLDEGNKKHLIPVEDFKKSVE